MSRAVVNCSSARLTSSATDKPEGRRQFPLVSLKGSHTDDFNRTSSFFRGTGSNFMRLRTAPCQAPTAEMLGDFQTLSGLARTARYHAVAPGGMFVTSRPAQKARPSPRTLCLRVWLVLKIAQHFNAGLRDIFRTSPLRDERKATKGRPDAAARNPVVVDTSVASAALRDRSNCSKPWCRVVIRQ